MEWDIEAGQVVSGFALGRTRAAPSGIAVHPGTKNLFVFWPQSMGQPNDDDVIFVPAGGEFTRTGSRIRSFDSLVQEITGAAFDSSANLFGVSETRLNGLDQTTGAPEVITEIPTLMTGLALDPATGNLFAYEPYASGSMFYDAILELDPSTGELLSTTKVPRSLFFGDDPFNILRFFGLALAFNDRGDKLYVGGATEGIGFQERILVFDRILVPEPSALAIGLPGFVVLILKRYRSRWQGSDAQPARVLSQC
jgi:DNA-binding beta-propeller fold protein YncE